MLMSVCVCVFRVQTFDKILFQGLCEFSRGGVANQHLGIQKFVAFTAHWMLF